MREVKAADLLTPEEWVSLINGEADGLPRCCANISALREEVIGLLRDDGLLGYSDFQARRFLHAYVVAASSHDLVDLSSGAIEKLREAVEEASGLSILDFTHSTDDPFEPR